MAIGHCRRNLASQHHIAHETNPGITVPRRNAKFAHIIGIQSVSIHGALLNMLRIQNLIIARGRANRAGIPVSSSAPGLETPTTSWGCKPMKSALPFGGEPLASKTYLPRRRGCGILSDARPR